MKTPPCCRQERHLFPPSTAEPKGIGDERVCRRCGLKQVAFATPPRAKVRVKWYYYP